MVKAPLSAPATLPPPGLDGLDPAWSRLVSVPGIDERGRTWHVLDNGVTNPRVTLLCVHGNPSWSYLFRNLLRDAPLDVRVVAVDQLEMGFSERSGTFRRLTTRVDDLSTLSKELGITGPVVTVAHDWGGPVSLGWAIRHKHQLAGVVLMNTAVHQPQGSPAPNIIRLARSKPMLRNVTVRTDTFIRGAVEMSRPRLPASVRRGFLAPYRSPDRRQAIGEFVADIPLAPDHSSAAALDAIAAGLSSFTDIPSLLVWGSSDPVFSDLYLHDLEDRLPHAAVHRHPKASHFVSEEVDAAGTIFDWLGSLGDVEHEAPNNEPSSLAHLAISNEPFDSDVHRRATQLLAAGIEPGDRVALMIPPGRDLMVVLYACWRLGVTIVLIDAGLGPAGMSAAISAANPAHLVGITKALAASRTLRWPGRRISVDRLSPATTKLLGIVADLSSNVDASSLPTGLPSRDDLAAVVFTSGATGPSKGVRYTHRQLEAQRDALVDLYGVTADDRLVAAFAPFALYGPAMGIPSVVPDMDVASPATLTASALGDAAVDIGATLVFASPAALVNVVQTAAGLTPAHRAAFAKVRLVLSAGAPVRPSLLRDVLELFPNASAQTPYGMTECLPVANISLDEIDEVGEGEGVCVGFPLPTVEVQIRPIDDSSNLGEVVVRAPHMRDGYDRLWQTEFDASQPSGWHATGDLGSLDAQGRLWIAGRLGHAISTPSGVVGPVRLEQAIESLDDVAAAAVVGVGPLGTQHIVAVVEPSTPVRSAGQASLEILDRVRAVVEEDVVAVLVVPALPVDRRHNSKIDRTRIAAWAEVVLAGGKIPKL